MGTIETILNDPSLSRQFVELAFTADKRRSDLEKMLDNPPRLHNCTLEIQADDGTWHEKHPSDWLLTVLTHGFHIARVKYPDGYELPRLG